jgi:hypothetical protein
VVGVVSQNPMIPYPLSTEQKAAYTHVLTKDIPGWNEHTTAELNVTAIAISNLTTEVRESHTAQERRDRAKEDKSPAKYYGSSLIVIYHLTHSASPAELPLLYSRIVASDKRSTRTGVEEHFREVADDAGTPVTLPWLPQQ